ncbi:flagellar protein FliT [Noviherbaspirillum massiliense]|uniref:flagellar protein FliT n=1 Tax=Noviherbaspirillum massiliense TaxID=1465823 RepID=UPI000315D830|nr:flagellar protein FliT [Noviherbaspirillum massiliense]
MNNQEIISIYETVAGITDQMLAAARSGDWELLAELETQCSSQVEILRKNDRPREALTEAAREQKTRVIKKILADDREIRNLTEPWMAQLSVMLNSAGTERKLSRTYGASQR